jgi:hypothetical protein
MHPSGARAVAALESPLTIVVLSLAGPTLLSVPPATASLEFPLTVAVFASTVTRRGTAEASVDRSGVRVTVTREGEAVATSHGGGVAVTGARTRGADLSGTVVSPSTVAVFPSPLVADAPLLSPLTVAVF